MGYIIYSIGPKLANSIISQINMNINDTMKGPSSISFQKIDTEIKLWQLRESPNILNEGGACR